MLVKPILGELRSETPLRRTGKLKGKEILERRESSRRAGIEKAEVFAKTDVI